MIKSFGHREKSLSFKFPENHKKRIKAGSTCPVKALFKTALWKKWEVLLFTVTKYRSEQFFHAFELNSVTDPILFPGLISFLEVFIEINSIQTQQDPYSKPDLVYTFWPYHILTINWLMVYSLEFSSIEWVTCDSSYLCTRWPQQQTETAQGRLGLRWRRTCNGVRGAFRGDGDLL